MSKNIYPLNRAAKEAAKELQAARAEQAAPFIALVGHRWPERAIDAGVEARLRRRWIYRLTSAAMLHASQRLDSICRGLLGAGSVSL